MSLRKQLDHAMLEYGAEHGISVPNALRDVMADMRHLCDKYRMDHGELQRAAHQVYLEEKQAEIDTQRKLRVVERNRGAVKPAARGI